MTEQESAEDHEESEEVLRCLKNVMRVHPMILDDPGNGLIFCNISLVSF